MSKEKPASADRAVEFFPDALEIKHEVLPWYARHGILLGLIFFAAALIWAIVGKVDIVIVGQGKLIADHDIVMKPLQTSVIKSIEVKVGDVVKKDQVLITFDPELSQADADRLASDIDTYTAMYERLQAEFEGRDYVPSREAKTPTGIRDQKWQLASFKQRRSFYNEKINYYDQSLKRIDASLKSTRDSLEKQKNILSAMSTIEEMYRGLQEKNAVSLREFLSIQINRMSTEAQVSSLENSLTEQHHQRLSMEAEKNSFVEEWRNSIASGLVEAQQNLTSALKQFAKAEQYVSYVHLRAPCDAVVHDIASFSPGSAVGEAEAVITLVPLDSRIEMQAEIRPQDIGKLRPNAEVRVKLSAFPFQKYGTLDGRVRLISENTFTRPSGSDGSPGATYYRVRIALSGKLHNTEPGFRLIPGMEATAEIKTGTRRIIDYITYPLVRGLDESFREP